MAEDFCHPQKACEIDSKFDIDEEDFICFKCIEMDTWQKSNNPILCTIRNHFNEFLAVQRHRGDEVIPVFSPNTQEFCLERYKAWPPEDGVSVAFTVSINQEKWYMSCAEDKEITFKKGTCPSKVSGNTSDAIFIFKDFSKAQSESFKFESSRHRNYYLASKNENGKQTLCLKRPADATDEGIRLKVQSL